MIEYELASLVQGEVRGDAETRAAFSHDASIFEVRPDVVVSPKSADDIRALVHYVRKHPGTSLTPRAGGTCMSGGPLSRSIVLDMCAHMSGPVRIQDDAATCQPGVYYRDFEKATLAEGLLLPSFPASRGLCAMGGIVGNNSGGEKSLVYGQTKNYVRGLKVVLSDGNEYSFAPLNRPALNAKMQQSDWEGELYRSLYWLIEENYDAIQAAAPRVSKNSSGYFLWDVWNRDTQVFDMTKLFCGSQGTLGIVTEMTLGLIRPKPVEKLLVLFLNDLAPVANVVETLLKHSPESLESFDDKTLSFTLRFLPNFVKTLGASNLLSLGLQFIPEAWMALTGGMPKLILLAEFAGSSDAAVLAQVNAALADVRKLGIRARIASSEREVKKYWTIRRESFNVLRQHTQGRHTAPFIDDMIVRPEFLPQFLPELYRILEPYHLTLTIAGHAGNGNFHIIPLMDFKDPKTRQIIPELSKTVYDLVLKYGGSITAEHNDGLIRGAYVEQMFGAQMYHLFQEVKHLFDPLRIFNPGKKVDVDWRWALDHIRRD